MANGHKEENVPQHHVRAGCRSRFKPSKYRNMFQIQKWHIHLLLSSSRLSLFVRSLSSRWVPLMMSVPDKKTQLSPTLLDAHTVSSSFSRYCETLQEHSFSKIQSAIIALTPIFGPLKPIEMCGLCTLAHSQPRLDSHRLKWRSALNTRANYIWKVDTEKKHKMKNKPKFHRNGLLFI